MNCNIGGQNYCLISNPIKDIKTRKEYFALARNVFGLDFSIWYNSGFCGEKFIPYTLFAQDKAVASVGVSVSDTPRSKSGFSCEEIREKDYHVFVLKDNEKIFKNNKISLPLLSHA